jgi:hypothetical protein
MIIRPYTGKLAKATGLLYRARYSSKLNETKLEMLVTVSLPAATYKPTVVRAQVTDL